MDSRGQGHGQGEVGVADQYILKLVYDIILGNLSKHGMLNNAH